MQGESVVLTHGWALPLHVDSNQAGNVAVLILGGRLGELHGVFIASRAGSGGSKVELLGI